MINREFIGTGTLWVCVDCYVLHCNGDISPDCPNPDDLLSRFDRLGITVTAGILFAEHECGRTDGDWSPDECECEERTFNWSSCDGCGSPLGGSRYAMTGWVPRPAP